MKYPSFSGFDEGSIKTITKKTNINNFGFVNWSFLKYDSITIMQTERSITKYVKYIRTFTFKYFW